MSELLKRWRDVLRTPGVQQEVNARHPLRLVFGSDPSGRPLFAVMTHSRPSAPDLPSSVIETTLLKRPDDQHVMLLKLKDGALFDVFAQLCDDLAHRSLPASDEALALRSVYSALSEWKRLLTARREHLSEEALRGLVAELWFGLQEARQHRPIDEIFKSWCGPHGGHQDFQFNDGTAVEVKGIRPEAKWVQISSEHQLSTDAYRVILAVLELRDAPPHSEGAESLVTLLARIRQQLVLTPAGATAFEATLAEFTDPFTAAFYAEKWYFLEQVERFEVSKDFPRLQVAGLPEGVVDVKYRIERGAMMPYRMEDTHAEA